MNVLYEVAQLRGITCLSGLEGISWNYWIPSYLFMIFCCVVISDS